MSKTVHSHGYTPDRNPLIARFHTELVVRGTSDHAITLFRRIICGYYRKYGRDLKWRRTSDPYQIYVSEIMLQQTQVERVERKYPEFIAAFPDFESLAGASLEEVLGIWRGMGYNRRAKALKEGAQRVMADFKGRLPGDQCTLATLPGIGPATAASIIAFAYNRPVVFIETNIRRVFIHFFFHDAEVIPDSDILPLVERTLVREHTREWYFALMDYGTMLKRTESNPNRRSSVYQKQARFEGSDRQIRGQILRSLLEGGEMEEVQLVMKVGRDPDRTRKLIARLEKEGMLARINGRIRIA